MFKATDELDEARQELDAVRQESQRINELGTRVQNIKHKMDDDLFAQGVIDELLYWMR